MWGIVAGSTDSTSKKGAEVSAAHEEARRYGAKSGIGQAPILIFLCCMPEKEMA